MGALLLAAAAGVIINITRLFDFRWTARTARIRAIRDRIKSSQEAGKSGDKPEKPRWLDDFPENLKHGVAGDALPGWEDILKYCRDKNYGFGRWTWHLLPVQLFFFFLGIALLGLGLLFEP